MLFSLVVKLLQYQKIYDIRHVVVPLECGNEKVVKCLNGCASIYIYYLVMVIYINAHFKEKESLVIFPETGSKKASFRQQRVGGPTSYLIPTTFTDSWS